MPQSQTLLGLSLNLGHIFLQKKTIEQVLTDCCNAITQTSLFNTAWIGLLSADKTRFKQVYFNQPSDAVLHKSHSADSFHTFILSTPIKSLGFSNSCILENHHVISNQLNDDIMSVVPWHNYVKKEQNSLIAIPVRLSPSLEPLGCLLVSSESENQFDDKIVTFLEDVSSQIAQVVTISEEHTNQENVETFFGKEGLQKVLSGASLGFWDWNYQTSHYEVNQQWLNILGFERTDCHKDISDWEDRVFEEDKEYAIELIANAIHAKQAFHAEYRMRHKSGHWVWVECVGSVVEWEEQGQALRLCGTLQDISQRKRAEELLSENEQRFRELLDSLPNIAIQGYDRNRNIIYWNKASEKMYGYTIDEVSNNKLEDLIIPDAMIPGVIEAIRQWHDYGKPIHAGELQLKNKKGEMKSVYSSHVMLKNPSGDSEMFCVDIDLTEQKATQEKLEQMAKFDQLTQLPNRNLFLERFDQALNETKRFNKVIAVLFMDLDNFKYINDTFGHDAGDGLLVQVANRLSQSLRKYDLISRFGGDEFVIALPHLNHEHLIMPLVEKLISVFDHPFELEGQSNDISCSIGISFYPDSGDDINNLLRYADMAMYKAKKSGRNCFHFFNEQINEQASHHISVAAALKEALDNSEYSVRYQPILERSSGEIIACEALIHWRSRKLGDMKPSEFIPVAEQSFYINQIDYWILEQIQSDIKNQVDSGKLPVRIFANFSERVFSDNKFLMKLEMLVKNKQLSSRFLGIELTEQVLLKAGEKPNRLLEFLHENGIALTLDNFGHGFSSISYLKNSPIDWLKIDRALIKSAAIDAHEASYINAIISMAADLNIKTVAMGVETNEQKRFIDQTQCDIVQGFFYYEPMNAESLKQLLKDRSG